jgi:hypothetical protein
VKSYKVLSEVDQLSYFKNDIENYNSLFFLVDQFKKLLNTLQLEMFLRCPPEVIAEVSESNPEVA